MQRFKRRTLQLGASIATLALVAAACGSSGTKSGSTGGNTGGGGTSGLGTQLYADNSGGSPRTGGTLTVLGVGDVDYMDPNVSYYTIGYLGLREWSRQLYNYPAIHGQTTTVVPDLATAMPAISNGGKKYSVTIRSGAMWNTTPPRQVTAADVVLGVKRSCNPVQPFGGQPDFQAFLVGYQDFCNAFANVAQSVGAIKDYINTHNIAGVQVDPSNPLTVDFTLTHPVSYFGDILTLPPFAPAPVEILQYLPASNDLAQHTISDGPYYVASYDAGKSIVYKRNPAWKASSDPLRKAYVNEIDVSETGNQQGIYQQILTNTPQADMSFDTGVPPSAIPGLVAQKNPNLNLQTEYSSNPYVLFNTVSPNNNGALAKVQVRQALAYALNRSHLIQDAGGPEVSPALTQILPPGMNGASPTYDMYPNDPNKAKQLLQAAGVSNLNLKFLYRPASQTSSKMFQTIQADLGQIGVTVTGVGVPNADFYTKYLEVPSTAKNGTWDLSLAGWGPDWYGDAAASFFSPLFDGRILPPTSSNFGLFNDPRVNSLIDQALSAPDAAAAGKLWHQADVQTMTDAAIFPITDPNDPLLHGSQVHNCIYVAAIQNCDLTNVWLSS
ncbi:MAG TPA: ABC transporter substrate-binding protein [Pseudonocardiaceae bacterium]|nr:ABC transporter substrate-binding protein [Pseudonocardiaceae bacterium]